MNNFKILSGLFIILFLACKENKPLAKSTRQNQVINTRDSVVIKVNDTVLIEKNKEEIIQEQNQIIPDTTINKKLSLSNYETLSKFYSGNKEIVTIDRVRESPVVIFSDKLNLEYLIAYHYEGSTINSFDCFEIGYLNDDKNLEGLKIYNTSEDNFKTETNLGLGITSEKIESIKGFNYKKNVRKNTTIITYRNTNFETSSFLKRYNMPSYFMEFTLKDNKVVKIKFGFDYP